MTTGNPTRAHTVRVLDRPSIAGFIAAPGVAAVIWRKSGNRASTLLESAVRRASVRFPDTRFGSIDVGDDARLAAEWAIEEVPTFAIFRDGTLLFVQSGVLDDGEVEVRLESAWSADMGEVRKTVDGHTAGLLFGLGARRAAHRQENDHHAGNDGTDGSTKS